LRKTICDILVCADASVYSVDNLSTGLRQNIDHLINAKNFTFRESDTTQPEFRSEKYDLILHFASRASPEEYQQHPIETLTANSQGTQNMLELARKKDAILVYASTSEVYGDAEEIPTPETYWGKVNPVGVRSCYDEGKRYGEALCMAYKRTYNLDTRILRLFNTYGPRIRHEGAYARAVPRFIRQALKGENITVFGEGKQTRSFCYITDTMNGILKVAANPKAKGEIFNIGNPNELSVMTLAEKIRKLSGSSSRIIHKPLPADDPKRRCPDITKAKTQLSWSPQISLEEGLKKTVSWFRAKLE
jgi:UDP-glucuronate decarboxylase